MAFPSETPTTATGLPLAGDGGPARAGDAPTGTITFVFTDIEGSTQLLQNLGDRYPALLKAHQAAIRAAVQAWRGYEVDTQGDSFLIAFQRAGDALGAAIAMQRALRDLRLEKGSSESSIVNRQSSIPLRVRMSLHTGEPTLIGDSYVGLDVHRAARFCSAAHGGQVLLSQTTYELVARDLPTGVELRDMGEHRLKDLRRPWRLYQVVIDGLPSDFPPLRTLNARLNNLPLAPTPLIGRASEAQAVLDRLRTPTIRLVTLMGPGGVGKTRLSLHLAAEMLDEFVDGIFFVNLAPITDPGLVQSTIAQTLGVREQTGISLGETLIDWLRPKSLLLVLDNFEQVSLAAKSVADLLVACPKLKVLATSRSPLRVRGENEFPLAPLPLPGGPPSEDSEPAGQTGALPPMTVIKDSPAVQLFVQRVQEIKPGFALSDETAPLAAEICRRLDGLPLAIELAAARVKLLPLPALLSRMDRRLPLLTGGARDLPARQRTLRDAIAWSYDLLSEGERVLFSRLAVFIGGRSVEAIEAVCAADETLPIDVLDGLGSLVDESLLRVEETSGEPRFIMLETIHEYALERLTESGEADSLRQRHAAYFLQLAEQAEHELHRPQQAEWMARLEAEHNNIRAALRWAVETKNADVALRMSGALWLFWYLRGYLREGREWVEKALAIAPADHPMRAKALNGAGTLAWAAGEYDSARGHYQAALAMHEVDGNQEGYGSTLTNLGLIAYAQGDYHQARETWEKSLAIKRAVGAKGGYVGPLNNLGEVARHQGDYATARARFEEALDIYRELGNQWGVANSLINLGQVAVCEGRDADALRQFTEALSLYRAVGNQSGEAIALENLGVVALRAGEFAEAQTQYEASLALRRAAGDRQGAATSTRGLGCVALARSDWAAARAHFETALLERRALADRRGLAESLEDFARLALRQGDPTRGGSLFGAAHALRQAIGAPLPLNEQQDHERELAAHVQDNAPFTAALDSGRRLPSDEAVQLALSVEGGA